MPRHSVAIFLAGLAFSIAGLTPEVAGAQGDPAVTPIGKVASLVGSATIEHPNAVVVQASTGTQPGRVKVGDPVYMGDVVVTGADGKIGVTFTDGTAFNLSSNARMVLNEFVYDPNGKSNSTLFSLTKGTFTFVAGKIAKTGDMKIDTPVATMGIRGTTPHIEISDNGTVKFSTLIEEGKREATEKATEKNGAAKQRQAKSAPAGTGLAIDKPNHSICRGC